MSSFGLALLSGLTLLLGGLSYTVGADSNIRDLKRMIQQYPELRVDVHVKTAMRNSQILYWVGIVAIVLACAGLSAVVARMWW